MNERNHIEELKKYVKLDPSYNFWKDGKTSDFNDFDMFCVEHCKDIEYLLEQLEYYSNLAEEYKLMVEKLDGGVNGNI